MSNDTVIASEPGPTYPTPKHGWTCFHCGEHFPGTFAGSRLAREHFGWTPDATAACLIKGGEDHGLLRKLRWQEFTNQLLTIAVPDDLRALGWTVAVHNDYRLDGVAHTFWLFTKGGQAVKGEGRTDAEALNQIRAAIAEQR